MQGRAEQTCRTSLIDDRPSRKCSSNICDVEATGISVTGNRGALARGILVVPVCQAAE
jgi:hypothetical protein